MKFKSQVYTQASGSIGGVTYARTRGVMYTRGRGLTTNPNTAAQQAVRASLSSQAAAWATLDPAQREAWTTYAAGTPVTNALGDPLVLTGQQMFIRCNSFRRTFAEAAVITIGAGGLVLPVPDAPSEFGSAVLTPVTDLAVTADPVMGSFTFNFAESDPWNLSDLAGLMVFASLPQPVTRNYFRGPFFATYVLPGINSTGNTNPLGQQGVMRALALALGVPVPLGSRVFFRFRATDALGRLSLVQEASAVAIAGFGGINEFTPTPATGADTETALPVSFTPDTGVWPPGPISITIGGVAVAGLTQAPGTADPITGTIDLTTLVGTVPVVATNAWGSRTSVTGFVVTT